MFSGKLRAGKWKKIVSTISNIVEESPIRISQDGINIENMDMGKVIWFGIHLKDTEIEDFNLDEEIVCGVNFVEMKKIMNRIVPSKLIEIKVDESMFFIKVLDGDTWRLFGLPQINIPKFEEITKPEISTTVLAKMEAEQFCNSIRDASIITDHLILVAEEESFFMKGGGSGGIFEGFFPKGKLTDYEIKENTKSIYGLSYLLDIIENMEYEISLSFGENLPMVIETEIGNAKSVFIVAPRVIEG